MRFDTMPWDKEFNPEEFREACAKAREANRKKGYDSSESGKTFEHQIETACKMYEESNKASVAKIKIRAVINNRKIIFICYLQ